MREAVNQESKRRNSSYTCAATAGRGSPSPFTCDPGPTKFDTASRARRRYPDEIIADLFNSAIISAPAGSVRLLTNSRKTRCLGPGADEELERRTDSPAHHRAGLNLCGANGRAFAERGPALPPTFLGVNYTLAIHEAAVPLTPFLLHPAAVDSQNVAFFGSQTALTLAIDLGENLIGSSIQIGGRLLRFGAKHRGLASWYERPE